MPLERSFYLRTDVVRIARDLLGKTISTGKGNELVRAVITETEAYAGPGDRASHAFAGRRTARNEAMYKAGGTAYVYLCYGIHRLFNVVTNVEGVPHAVLVRAVAPAEGLDIMLQRRNLSNDARGLARLSGGPGTLTEALGIGLQHNGTDLLNGPVSIDDAGIRVSARHIIVGPRIGVDYAGADALLPYRFRIDPSFSFTAR